MSMIRYHKGTVFKQHMTKQQCFLEPWGPPRYFNGPCGPTVYSGAFWIRLTTTFSRFPMEVSLNHPFS